MNTANYIYIYIYIIIIIIIIIIITNSLEFSHQRKLMVFH